MQSPEETFFAERILLQCRSIWRGTTGNGTLRSVLRTIPGSQIEDIDLCKNRTFCCGAGGGCFWKEEGKGTKRINHERFDQINAARPQPLAVGCPFCMTQMKDALKARSLVRRVDARPRLVGVDRGIN